MPADPLNELALYLEQLLFLIGTLLYGFLTRELLRRREVLAGNWPVRLLVVCLTLWFGGTLLDQTLYMLVGTPRALAVPGTALDLCRAFAWLLSLPLLVHTLQKITLAGFANWPLSVRYLHLPAYLSLGLFAAPAVDFARSGQPLLGAAVPQLYPLIIAHAVLSLGLAAWLAIQLSRRIDDHRLLSFLRALGGILAALLALLVASGFFAPWSDEATGWERLLRTVLLGGLVLPGALFTFYVQRYNLLRLSLSHGTLRHFLGVLVLVLLVIAAGPALGGGDVQLLRRFVAWGLLLALLLGTVYRPLERWAASRSPALRRLLGKNLSPRELDRLMNHIQNIDTHESEALRRTAAELGRWLGSQASFLPAPEAEPATAPFWSHFAGNDAAVVHRLAPPSSQLASLLTRQRLHAVFPLRVEGELEGVLALSTSATGGAYSVDELEAVRLVIRQLAGTLALRRLLQARLAEETRLVEQERLGMLGLVSASLAHEIKNPLSSMKALAQALREDLAAADDGANGVADLDIIVEQIDRLHETTREILGLARPRAGEPADLGALVQSAVYVLQAEARKRGVELASAIDPVGPVAGSAAAWQTVIFNLVLNAIEHTPVGGRAAARLSSDDEGIVFETSNPGEPLDAEARHRIFEPFVSTGGTGLGLPLVARRVDEIGGEIEVSSRAEQVVFSVAAPSLTAEGAG
ncbi:MAG: HAMP domain-containing sensor histidine kinase [Acidobacteriota bacterium]